MNFQIEKLIKQIDKSSLEKKKKDLTDIVQEAWEDNEDARKAIDFKNLPEKGERKILDLRESLEEWSDELEDFSDVIEKISEWASNAIHTRRRDVGVEEDLTTHGDNKEEYKEDTGSERKDRE